LHRRTKKEQQQTILLEKYYANQEQGKHSSQDTAILTQDNNNANQDEDIDDGNSITVIPPPNNTPRHMEPTLKKPRTTKTMEDQTILTQIWAPIHKVHMTQEDHEGNTAKTRNEYQETLDQPVQVVNLYSRKKTPTVTPQKTATHTKSKQGLPTGTTHLKNPPSYSLTSLTQEQNDKALSQELEEIVQNTEQRKDEATEEFLRTEDKETADGHAGNKERSLVIEGIGLLFGATNKAAMNALNKYMDDLGDKYRRIIKEYEDRKSSHEQTFQQALQDIAGQYEQQARARTSNT
jgi:hypothetical protein